MANIKDFFSPTSSGVVVRIYNRIYFVKKWEVLCKEFLEIL
jgi:hypothetical protein